MKPKHRLDRQTMKETAPSADLSPCRCGRPILYPFHQLGCIECGADCCPACAVPLESTTYCARCAESILEVP